jgi:archaellum component FlaC
MAQLSKQEIAAIAGKLQREIIKKASEIRKQTISNYVPSDSYKKLQKMFEELEEKEELYKKLNAEISLLSNNIREYLNSKDIYTGVLNKIDILEKVVLKECVIPEIPDLCELKDDITIAAIGDEFDANAYINNILSKF